MAAQIIFEREWNHWGTPISTAALATSSGTTATGTVNTIPATRTMSQIPIATT